MLIRKRGWDNRQDQRTDQTHKERCTNRDDCISSHQQEQGTQAHAKESQPEGTLASQVLNDHMPTQANQQDTDCKSCEMKTSDGVRELQLFLQERCNRPQPIEEVGVEGKR